MMHIQYMKPVNYVPAITSDSAPVTANDGGKMIAAVGKGQTGVPLYYVDGIETTESEMRRIPVKDIVSIDVLKGESAAPFGEKGRNGVLLITTKRGLSEAKLVQARRDSAGHPAPEQFIVNADSSGWVIKTGKDSQAITMKGASMMSSTGVPNPRPASLIVADSYKGLIMLDGKEISRSELMQLDPITIKTYNMYSGDAAVKVFGERGRRGVLTIVSK
jgi:TonB-dependent SusC/RagA subfamily outer membrane receptor